MKICSPQLGLDPNSYLGGEVHDFQLIDELCKKGIKFEVLLPKGKKYQKNPNLNVEFLPVKRIFPPHLFNLYVLSYLIRKCRQGFDILRLHNPYFLGLAGLIFKKIFPKSKIVTTIHLKETRKDLDLILRKTIHVYDHIFTVSQYLKDWIIKEYKYPEDKITVIYNGVDPLLKHAEKKSNKETFLLNIGLMNQRKNIGFLVKVFQELVVRYPSLRLVLCGSGPEKQKIKRIVNKLSLKDKITVMDPVFGYEKNELFNSCDIFLFPSKEEGFGLVATEAMACGKPVVASNNSSLPEVVDNGRTGYLARTSDLKDWASKISKLVDDPKLRYKMGQAGLKKVREEFNWDKVADKTLDEYNKICK